MTTQTTIFTFIIILFSAIQICSGFNKMHIYARRSTGSQFPVTSHRVFTFDNRGHLLDSEELCKLEKMDKYVGFSKGNFHFSGLSIHKVFSTKTYRFKEVVHLRLGNLAESTVHNNKVYKIHGTFAQPNYLSSTDLDEPYKFQQISKQFNITSYGRKFLFSKSSNLIS